MSALAKSVPGQASTTRLRKVWCSECGYTVRMSRSWIAVGLPSCPNPECACFGTAMDCADFADAVNTGHASLSDLPRVERTRVCRLNGWEDEIIRTSPGRRSKPKQCAEIGCGKFVPRGEKFCSDHTSNEMPF